MTYSNFINSNFTALQKTLNNSLSNTDRELLFESIKRFNEKSTKNAIKEYNAIDFTGE
jgi:hypothetical protein